MKIQIASDMHLETRSGAMPDQTEFVPVADRDVLVLAGDIGIHTVAERFIDQQLRFSPVIYVPGNHEYYGLAFRDETDEFWAAKARETGALHYLNSGTAEIGGVRFFGAPWYSDLCGRRGPDFVRTVAAQINDFSSIGGGPVRFGAWSVREHLEAHAEQTRAIRALARQVDVVVTHWPPTWQAIGAKWAKHPLNPYFANDAEGLVREVGAQLWLSGHVHTAHDVMIGETRSAGNPTGYPHEAPSEGYSRAKVITVRAGA